MKTTLIACLAIAFANTASAQQVKKAVEAPAPEKSEAKEAPDAWPLVKLCLEKQVGLVYGRDQDFWQKEGSNERTGGVNLKSGLIAKLKKDGKFIAAVNCLKAGEQAAAN